MKKMPSFALSAFLLAAALPASATLTPNGPSFDGLAIAPQAAPQPLAAMGVTNSLGINGGGFNGPSWNGNGWNGINPNGPSWNGAGWNGAAWNGAAWNGGGWNGGGWNGTAWNGGAWNGADKAFVALSGVKVQGGRLVR